MYLHCIYTLPDLLSTPCSNIFQEKFPLPQGCSKVGSVHSKPETRRPKSELIATPAEQPPIESGHSRNSELPQITQMGADNKAGRLRQGLFPIGEYRRQLRLRNSEFGLLSGFGLRSSDFRLWSDGGVGTQSLGLKIARNRRSFRRSVRQWTRTEYPKGIGSIPSGIGCLVRAPTAT